MTISHRISTLAGLGFCALLGACNPFGSETESDEGLRFSLQAFPDTLYVGVRYSLNLDLGPFAGLGTYSLRTRLSEVLIDSSSNLSGGGLTFVSWTVRPRQDTLVIRVDHANGSDSLARVVVPTFATGFAPLASSAVREYERYQFLDNVSSTSRVVLTPLGTHQGGFRFEVKSTTAPDSAGMRTTYSRDTVLLRMNGNTVESWNGTVWNAPGFSFPYFIQDTITNLNANAGTANGVFGTIGASEYPIGQGTYQRGVGLIRFRNTYYISMRRSDSWGLTLL